MSLLVIVLARSMGTCVVGVLGRVLIFSLGKVVGFMGRLLVRFIDRVLLFSLGKVVGFLGRLLLRFLDRVLGGTSWTWYCWSSES